MPSDIGYNLSAICVIMQVVCYYYLRKQIPVFENKIFIVMAWIAVASCAVDILLSVMQMNPEVYSKLLHYFFTSIYFILRNSLPFCFAIYVVSVTSSIRAASKVSKAMLGIAALLEFVVISINPFTYSIFYIAGDGSYHRGSGIYIVYIISGFFMIYSVYYTINMKDRLYLFRRMNRLRRVTIYAFVLICVASSLIQFAMPGLPVESIGVAICILMVYTNVQRPEELTDGKTMLWNSTAFYTIVRQWMDRITPFGILIFQADRMDIYRSTFGIQFVDDIQVYLATYLNQYTKSFWIYAVNEGTFFLVQKRSNPENLTECMEQLHQEFQKPINIKNYNLKLHVHICKVRCPEDAKNVEQVFDYSEALAYQKHEEDAPMLYAGDIDISYRKREKEVEHAIHRAIDGQAFEVFFQPIYGIAEKRFVSAEALVRLTDEELGFISPEEFIPIAERSGAILEIGSLVFRETCRFLSEQKPERFGIDYLEINLSVVQCMQVNLPEKLMGILQEYGIETNRIVLEITETAAAYSEKMLEENMRKLCAEGIRFAIDDYGTGYSNMTNLLKLPFSLVKLDKSIIWAAFKGEAAMVAVNSIVGMVEKIQMQTVAEGVETEEQKKALSELGCNYLQGYHFSKPLPAKEFMNLLDS